jgi:ATP-dependent 26S proteasome regulatory subunit
MATNRIDSLDPALIRPGRIDRKIEFPLPDEKTRRMIFKIHTGRMTLADDVNLEELIMAKDDLSGADIKVCLFTFFLLFLLVVLNTRVHISDVYLGYLYGIRPYGIT